MRRTPDHRPRFQGLLAFAATSLLAVTAATAQVAHGDTSALDDSGNYREEVQACREGRTAEDRATCLKEARSAQADRRRGALGNSGDFQANALARCDVHKDRIDHEACRERIMSEAGLSGSVAGGGLLREYVVTLPPEQDPSRMGAGPEQGTPPQAQEPLTPWPAPDMPAAPDDAGSGSDPGSLDQQQQEEPATGPAYN